MPARRLMAALGVTLSAVIALAARSRIGLTAIESRAFSVVFPGVVVFLVPLPSMAAETWSAIVFLPLFLAQASEPFMKAFKFGVGVILFICPTGEESHLRPDHHPFFRLFLCPDIDLDSVVINWALEVVVLFEALVIF